MSTLLLIPLEDTVVFPKMDVTRPQDTHREERVRLVPRHEGEFAHVGTIEGSVPDSAFVTAPYEQAKR